MRINQYIAHSGLCSRRQAEKLIKDGKVTLNGQVVLNVGALITENDNVFVEGKIVRPEKFVYILLNKPKDHITTTSDEQGRKTVMDIIEPVLQDMPDIGKVRIYPVGRLDRNTTGLLLLTNDGELTNRLTHPKFGIEKIYMAELTSEITVEDMEKLANGIELEDGVIRVDDIAYADPNDKRKVGVAIHSGRNRLVRRMFAHLGYHVKYLDRIVFATLTKKNLPRGYWRFLTEFEILQLKNLNNPNPAFLPPEHTFKSVPRDKMIFRLKAKKTKENKPSKFKKGKKTFKHKPKFEKKSKFEGSPKTENSNIEVKKPIKAEEHIPLVRYKNSD